MSLRSFVIAFLCLALGWAGSVTSATAQPAEKPAKADRMVRVTYPVGDLIVDTANKEKVGRVDNLIKIITETVSPTSWKQSGGAGAIQYFPMGMAFVVYQTAETQEKLASLLGDLRKHAECQISIESRAVRVSPKDAEPIRKYLAQQGNSVDAIDAKKSSGVVTVDDKQLRQLLENVQSAKPAYVMQVPKITLFNGQSSKVGGMVQGSGGTMFEYRPVVSPDRRSVRLAMTYEYCRTADSVERIMRATKCFNLPDGRTLVWNLGKSAEGEHLFLLVTARILVLPKEEERIFLGELPSIPREGGAEEQAIPEPKKAEKLVRKAYLIGNLTKSMALFDAKIKNESAAAEWVKETIQDAVAKKTWERNGGNGTIQYFPHEKKLVVNQTNDAHEDVELLLATLRKLYDLSVDVESRSVLISAKTAKPFRKTLAEQGKSVDVIDGEKSSALVSIDDAQLLDLLKLAQIDRVAHFMQAPKTSFFNGQTLKVGVPQSMADGMQFDYRPIVSPDRRSVRLEMTFAHWTTADSVKRATWATKTFNLPDGRTLVWDFGETVDRQHLFLFVTPQIRSLQDAEEKTVLGELPAIPR